MIWNRKIVKVVTEKEYDDVEQNKIINVDVVNKLFVFGIPLFKRSFNENLVSLEGGEYKSKEKRIGFGK